MRVPMFDVMDTEIEASNDALDSNKKSTSSATKLERRRRIEELHEERFMRDEWGDM